MTEPVASTGGSGRLAAAGVPLLGLGLLLLALATAIPDDWLGDGGWSEEDAIAHQRAAADTHRLTFEAGDNQELQRQLRDARLTLAELDSRLQEAAGSADRRRSAIRWAGLGCCLLGAAIAFAQRIRHG